jgi:hypothetical protein
MDGVLIGMQRIGTKEALNRALLGHTISRADQFDHFRRSADSRLEMLTEERAPPRGLHGFLTLTPAVQ